MMEELKVHIVGSDNVPKNIQQGVAMYSNFMHLHGYMPEDDLMTLFNSTKAFVAPLLSGAGVKGKVNQAMKYRLPIVGTPVAFEAMYTVDGVDSLTGTTVAEFVDKLVQVYTNCSLWAQLSEGGLLNMHQHFGLERAREDLLTMMRLVGVVPASVLGQCVQPTQRCSSSGRCGCTLYMQRSICSLGASVVYVLPL